MTRPLLDDQPALPYFEITRLFLSLTDRRLVLNLPGAAGFAGLPRAT